MNKYLTINENLKQIIFCPEIKRLILKLTFFCDRASSTFKRCFRNALSDFTSAQLICVFTTRSVPISSPKDCTHVLSHHNVIYKFQCDCGSSYVGRTGRRLGVRISEHVPRWLGNDIRIPPRSTGTPDSAVTRHFQIFSTIQPLTASQKFSVVHRSDHFNKLRILEAINIKRLGPDLCTQKDHVMTLEPPW